MTVILIHSSKTMRTDEDIVAKYQAPKLLSKASELAAYVSSLTTQELEKSMHLSPAMAIKTRELMKAWSVDPAHQMLAIDAFLGDIYSGLQVAQLTLEQREYANQHLYILSGLYGVLRPLDGIRPYRLEMGYRFADEPFKNLYSFWGRDIAETLPSDELIVNLSAVEYTKAVLPYLPNQNIISPKFLTLDPRTHEPKFVAVHAKIARGAFARWMIVNEIEDVAQLKEFSDLNYRFNVKLSKPNEPVFICESFGGLGLSVRLVK
ncbi:MAG: YaaA family protein [Candidatus Saccharimonas sp.]